MTRKEKGATPFENAPHGATAQADITTPAAEVEARALYNPLTWRTPEVQQQDGDQAQTPDPLLGWHALAAPAKAKLPRGKAKRNARRAALQAKRHQGGISTFDMLAHLALGAWLATVLLWAWEALQ